MPYRLTLLLFFPLLTISVAYGQDSLSQRITRQSLENALNEGFMISKVNNIAFAIGGYVQTNVFHDFYRIGSDADFHPSRIEVPTERYPRTRFNVRDSRLRVTTKSTRDDAPPFLIMLEVDFMNDH